MARARCQTLVLVAGTAGFVGLDSGVLTILVEPIKRDLGLSDTEIGLLVGLSVTLVSSLSSLPFSRWADVGVRRTVLIVALVLSSIGTLWIGFARGFWEMLAARLAQGVGRGGGETPGQSILADLYAPHERATALAFLTVGSMTAMTLGRTAAAFLADVVGWRAIFWGLAIAGFALGAVVRGFLQEPPRQATPDGGPHSPALSVVIGDLRSRATFRHVTIAMTLLVFSLMGVFGWAAPYLMRSFDKTLAEVALVVGLGFGGVVAVGGIAGGMITDRLAQRDLRWHLWLPLAGTIASAPFFVGYLLLPVFLPAVLCGAAAMFLLGIYIAPLQAAVLGSVHPGARAVSLAVLSVFASGVGATAGTLLVGMLSDWLEPVYGIHSLRWAMVSVLPGSAWACVHLWIASRHYAAEAEAGT